MAVVTSAREITDPVEATVEAVVGAVAARIDAMVTRDQRVAIDLGEGSRWVADGATGRLATDAPSRAVDAEVVVAPKVAARILNGTMEPRHAVLFGLMEVRGSLATAVRWFDELAGTRWPPNHAYSPAEISLPAPTRDGLMARRQLRVHGYCIVSDVLDPDLLRRLRTRLVDQAAAEREADVATRDGGAPTGPRDGSRKEWWMETPTETSRPAQPNQRVWALQNKGDVFLELLEIPVIDEVVPDFLGDYFLIAELSANIVGSGGEAMVLHQDQSPVQPPLPVAVGVNMMLCLDDFTAENGATRVIPGSHITENGLAPDDIYSTDGTVAAVAPAGSAILYDSRLWHGTGPNTTSDQLRHGLYILFFRSWMRTQHNQPLSVHPSVLEKMSDRVKTMFGHRVTGALGKVQHAREGDFVRWDPDQLVLEMTPKGGPSGRSLDA